MKSVKLYVPATIGNVGPGFDVLGLAIEGLGNTYELSLSDEKSMVREVAGVDVHRVPREASANLTLLAAEHMARKLGYQNAFFSLKVYQELPVGGGLGSSAAACLAGAYGAACLLGRVESSGILNAAYHFEGHYDNIAPAYFGGLTIASADGVMQVPQGYDVWIVVVTPESRLATKTARSVLPKELPQAQWVRQMALSSMLVCAWQKGDLEGLSKALQDPYAEPRRAGLIPGFYDVKKKALESGALGVSISGAGPSVFSVFGQNNLARDFAEKYRGHCAAVSKQGIRLC